jgi:hypothetical protein
MEMKEGKLDIPPFFSIDQARFDRPDEIELDGKSSQWEKRCRKTAFANLA